MAALLVEIVRIQVHQQVRHLYVVPRDFHEARAGLTVHDFVHLQQRLLKHSGAKQFGDFRVRLERLSQVILECLTSRFHLSVFERMASLEISRDYVIGEAVQLPILHVLHFAQ